MRIAISPDENPGDPGAVHNGIVERDVNVKVATALEAALKRCGQDAWFDPSITYTQRVEKANADGSHVLVACAHNAAGSPAAEGALFLFCGEEAHHIGKQQEAADKCGQALVAGGLVAHYGTYDEDVVECCDFNNDTVYCELGYETNPNDAARIKQPDYPVRAAELLAQGLAATYGFPYAPLVHPSAPTPEWKANLQQLPAPVVGVLAADVDVVDTLANQVVETLKQGSSFSAAYETRVRGTDFYMTQFAVDHASGYAEVKAKVTFEGLGEITGDAPGKTPPSTPPSTPPAQQPDDGGKGFLGDLENTLVGFADHELIQLIELAIKEFKKRAGIAA